MSALPKNYGLSAFPKVDEELIAAPPPWLRSVGARLPSSNVRQASGRVSGQAPGQALDQALHLARGSAMPAVTRPSEGDSPDAGPNLVAKQAVDLGLSVLETKHPAIAKAVVILWGSREMNEYLTQICLSEGVEPIDPDAMSDLMLLSRIHHSVVPTPPNPHSMASFYDASAALSTPRKTVSHSHFGPRRGPVSLLHRR